MKIRLVGSLLMAAAIVLSSCHPIEKKPETVEVHILDDFSNAQNPINAYYLDAIESFEKKNPNIKVIVDPPGDKLSSKQKIMELLNSDQPVDLIPLDANAVQDKSLLLDLLPLSSSSGSTGMDIYPEVLNSTLVKGSLFVLPIRAHPEALLIRKDAFDAADVPYPEGEWTWEQFREVSKRIQTAQKKGSVLPYDLNTLDLLMASTGKSMISPEGETFVGFLDSPEAVRSIQWLNAYYADDPTKSAPMSSSDSGIEFNDRQAGMGLGNAFAYKIYSEVGAENIGVVPLPYFEGGKKANPVSFNGYGIAGKSKNPQAAWKLLEYLCFDKNQFSIEIAKFNMTTSASMAESTGQTPDPIKSIFEDELRHSVKAARDFPFVNETWNDAMMTEFQALMRVDDQEIQVGLHNLAEKLDQELHRLKNETEKVAQTRTVHRTNNGGD